jgi:hypothetical protein
MSVLPVWNFRRSPFYDVITKTKPETFKEFLTAIWTNVERDLTDTQLLIDAACEKFGIDDVNGLIEFTDSRLSETLQNLFLEVTQSFFFKPDRLIEIRALLEREIKNPLDKENGVNHCVAMWLMGTFEGAFNDSYDFPYLNAFYTQGATLPLFNGEIPEYSQTQIKTETEYKDRVIFSVLINDLQVMARKAVSMLGLFTNGDLSELGNILRTDTSLFGLGGSSVYNHMRLIVQMYYTLHTANYFTEYHQFNPRYHTNKDNLQQIHEKYPNFDVQQEFDTTYTRMINMLTIINLSATGMIPFYLKNNGAIYFAILFKDYQFIENYLEEYCSKNQVISLRKRLVDSGYLIYKDILKTLAIEASSFNLVEGIFYELLPFFETLAEQVYGPENHMAHVIFAMKKCQETLLLPPNVPATNSEYLYWSAQPKIYDDLAARQAFETAAKAGSISARIQLKCAFLQSKNDTIKNSQTAMDWDLEGIMNKNSLGSIGLTYDMIGLFIENQNNAGEHSELVREYIREKIVGGDLGFPAFAVSLIEELKQDATNENDAINFYESELSAETVDGWHSFICNIFPYLKNRMLTHKKISAECALLTMCGELGSPYATITLNYEAPKDIFFEMLAPVCPSLERLTNPKTMPYYLMTDNWFRFAHDYASEECQHPKNAIRIIHYIDGMFDLFEQFEAHVQTIIDKGEIPSIELVGVGINFVQYLFYLSQLILDLEKPFDRHIYRDTTEQIFNFWSKRSSLDMGAVSINKLADFMPGRQNRLLCNLTKGVASTRLSSSRINVLCNALTAHQFLDALSEFSPYFDSPLGVIYTIYISYIEKVFYEALKQQNHLECMNISLYVRYLHSLIYANSNVFTDVIQNVKQSASEKNPGKLDIQGKTKAIASHQAYIDNTRKILANTKSMEECVLELKKIVVRGSSYAAEIYHFVSVSSLNGRPTFMPFDSYLLQCCMNILSQRPMVDYLSRNQQIISMPYMALNLFLYNEEESKFSLDEDARAYLLKTLVSYGEIFALAYDAYTAAISPDNVSMIGTSFEDALNRLKSALANNKSVIQLLESPSKHEYSYKFIQSKQKFKIQDITCKDWMYCFLLSSSAKFLSE